MNLAMIGGMFEGVLKGLDGLFTSDEERLQVKTQIMMVQAQVMAEVLGYEKAIMQAQSDVIQSEAKGDSWLQRSWRPVTMLTFVGLVVARWLGFTTDITPEIESQLMTLIQIGIGGYVVGRSAEKVVKAIDFGKIKAKE